MESFQPLINDVRSQCDQSSADILKQMLTKKTDFEIYCLKILNEHLKYEQERGTAVKTRVDNVVKFYIELGESEKRLGEKNDENEDSYLMDFYLMMIF